MHALCSAPWLGPLLCKLLKLAFPMQQLIGYNGSGAAGQMGMVLGPSNLQQAPAGGASLPAGGPSIPLPSLSLPLEAPGRPTQPQVPWGAPLPTHTSGASTPPGGSSTSPEGPELPTSTLPLSHGDSGAAEGQLHAAQVPSPSLALSQPAATAPKSAGLMREDSLPERGAQTEEGLKSSDQVGLK